MFENLHGLKLKDKNFLVSDLNMDEPKPVLLHKLEGSTNEIHAAIIIPGTNL